MGICSCCCFFFDESTVTFDQNEGSRPYTTSANPQCLSPQRPVYAVRHCRYCHHVLDPSLLDGHQESCRVNRLKALKLTTTSTDAVPDNNSDIDNASEDELCVICYEKFRCYVFLPCGHIACCGECAKRLDFCPICRTARSGLCYVPVNTLSQYYCTSCNEFIAPTLFDGHRETCALIRRQFQQSQTQLNRTLNPDSVPEASKDRECAVCDQDPFPVAEHSTDSNAMIEDKPPTLSEAQKEEAQVLATPHHTKASRSRCLECGKERCQLVICIPCGHRVMCVACAATRSICSVCFQEIERTLASFD